MRTLLLLILCSFALCAQRSGGPINPRQPDHPSGLTYSKQISRIFQAKCEICHREGDIAPFALKDYQTASLWAEDIKRVVDDGIMPPWKPVAGHGDFKNSFALTADERQAIIKWVSAGAPEGDPADAPAPLPDRGEWPLGSPDQIMSMVQDFIPPRGRDVYRCFVMPESFDETKYVSAVDVLPGDRKIVHHVILFLDTKGESVNLEGKDGQPGYDCFGGPNITLSINFSLGGWAPGQRSQFLPDGIGMELPKGARIVMQVHYYPAAGTGPDKTRLGLYFNKTAIQQRLFIVPVINTSFKIPAGAESYDVDANFRVLPMLDAKAIWVYPHMHLLGRQINARLEKADGTVQPLIYEDDWDFNWQGSYTYAEPVPIKAGDNVHVTCTFNNSDSNPKNPNNPLVDVGWGERTTDEMCIGFFGVTLDYEKLLPLANRPKQ